ncbi:hypothetical protein LINPERHAP1_LOCUS42034 [Linum perenne]
MKREYGWMMGVRFSLEKEHMGSRQKNVFLSQTTKSLMNGPRLEANGPKKVCPRVVQSWHAQAP